MRGHPQICLPQITLDASLRRANVRPSTRLTPSHTILLISSSACTTTPVPRRRRPCPARKEDRAAVRIDPQTGDPQTRTEVRLAHPLSLISDVIFRANPEIEAVSALPKISFHPYLTKNPLKIVSGGSLSPSARSHHVQVLQ